MRRSAVSAIIFSNSNDRTLKELTENRSMASLPFGGRYRLIDFALSNLVNAGISNIGIITKENYRSLMDHIGSGVYWDLDRKNGGIHVLPPYNKGRTNKGYFEALMRAKDFITRSNCDYVVTCESGIVANIDITALVNQHLESNADITIVYRKASCADKYENTMMLKLDENKKIKELVPANSSAESGNYTLGVAVFSKSALVNIISSDENITAKDFYLDILPKYIDNVNLFGFEHDGFVSVMDCGKSFFNANMELLKKEVRDDLFNKERPIYTKTRDDMPTRYGIYADVSNSFIADGCIIDGTVKNSVLFRGVRVKKGAVVENSILMQGVEVFENAKLKYVISDKNAVISANSPISGSDRKAFILKKNQMI